jgi:hypothetical protein
VPASKRAAQQPASKGTALTTLRTVLGTRSDNIATFKGGRQPSKGPRVNHTLKSAAALKAMMAKKAAERLGQGRPPSAPGQKKPPWRGNFVGANSPSKAVECLRPAAILPAAQLASAPATATAPTATAEKADAPRPQLLRPLATASSLAHSQSGASFASGLGKGLGIPSLQGATVPLGAQPIIQYCNYYTNIHSPTAPQFLGPPVLLRRASSSNVAETMTGSGGSGSLPGDT